MRIAPGAALANPKCAAKSIKDVHNANWMKIAMTGCIVMERKLAMSRGDVPQVRPPHASVAMEVLSRFVKWTAIVKDQRVHQAVSAMRSKIFAYSVWPIANARRTLLSARTGPVCLIAACKLTMRSVVAGTVFIAMGPKFALVTR
jgi:hypothetical protein